MDQHRATPEQAPPSDDVPDAAPNGGADKQREARAEERKKAARGAQSVRFRAEARGFVGRHLGILSLALVLFIVAYAAILTAAWHKGAQGDSASDPRRDYTAQSNGQGASGAGTSAGAGGATANGGSGSRGGSESGGAATGGGMGSGSGATGSSGASASMSGSNQRTGANGSGTSNNGGNVNGTTTRGVSTNGTNPNGSSMNGQSQNSANKTASALTTAARRLGTLRPVQRTQTTPTVHHAVGC